MKYYLFANWKMAQGVAQGVKFIQTLEPKLKKFKTKRGLIIGIIPSFESLGLDNLVMENLALGAQNISEHDKGSYTGEVSVLNLKELGVEYVLIGHSERRIYYKETDDLINKKIKLSLSKKMKVIFCIGENMDVRKKVKHFKVIRDQIIKGLNKIDKKEFKNIVIAYEPIWAISGFQKTKKKVSAKNGDIVEMIEYIKKIFEDYFGQKAVKDINIIYGGSINTKNADEVFSINDNQGGLVGSASLDAKEFFKILQKLIDNKY